jgi:ATP-dependent helicase/nuclease subunit B
MHARFLLGPAGSGKTHRCLAEIRAELNRAPDGPPLLLLAPKQATFQLERQLLSDPSLAGYTRLQILSFERLAQFVLDEFRAAPPELLSEEGRVMVMRALLLRHQGELKIFRASARLAGFAQQLSLLLRDFQRHKLPPARLDDLCARAELPPPLRAKLHDLALLLRAYADWLKTNQLQDAAHLLDVATETLHAQSAIGNRQLAIANVWLDGFAEMTPQELDLLAALAPLCDRATLAFCLEGRPEAEPSWLSTWSVVAQTFRRCHAQLAAMDGIEISFETLSNAPGHGRFANNDMLHTLETGWSQSSPKSNSDKSRAGVQSPKSEAGVRLVECADAEAEAEFAAREILRHVRAGGRFRECAVIVRSLEPCHAVLARVFRRYEIPVFMDRREAVSHHPLAELTRFALRTALYNWRHDDWFGALKTGLVPAGEGELDRLENEALARGWEGRTWRSPLPEQSRHLEKLRLQIFPPFGKFADALAANSAAPTGAQLAGAIRKLWDALDVEQTLERWSEATSRTEIHATVFSQMNEWLENLERAFAAEAQPLRDWLPILEAGLANLTVGVVPPALDQVLIGAIDRSRNPDLRLALILGLNEGVFPAPPAPGTLLTDADRAGLENAGIYLGPTARQRLGHERYLGYIACTRSAGRLALAWSAKNSDGEPLNPSPFIAQVRQITGVAEEKFSGAEKWEDAEHVCELEASLRQLQNCGMLPRLAPLAPLAEKWRQAGLAACTQNLSPATVERLFGRELKTSVSALEEFAACPFKFFTARGLRLRERKEFQFDARDKGSFQHAVLEEFHRRVRAAGREWRDLTPTEAGNLAAEIGRELLPGYENGKFLADGAARFTGSHLIERLRRLMTALVAWTPQYGFDPVVCEAAFDDDQPGGLPAWRFDLGGGRALLLRGRVDRVDLFRRGDASALAVVMDYKSSVRKLDDTRLHHGLDLQLLSYLGMLRNLAAPEKYFGVKSLTPAGVFYVPLNGGAERTSAPRAEVLAADDDLRRLAYQHSGRFLGEELPHFDNRNVRKGDQFRYARNKDGSFSLRGNEALPAPEFEALREAVEEHLRDHGRRIFGGEVDASPFRIGNATACEQCDFRPVCRFDPWTQPFRALRPPKKGRPA